MVLLLNSSRHRTKGQSRSWPDPVTAEHCISQSPHCRVVVSIRDQHLQSGRRVTVVDTAVPLSSITRSGFVKMLPSSSSPPPSHPTPPPSVLVIWNHGTAGSSDSVSRMIENASVNQCQWLMISFLREVTTAVFFL